MSADCNQREHRGLVALARKQTLGEEIANSLSHGAGLAAAVAGTPVLIVTALRHHNTAMVVGGSVFSGTVILMYLSSLLYHLLSLCRGVGERVRVAQSPSSPASGMWVKLMRMGVLSRLSSTLP